MLTIWVKTCCRERRTGEFGGGGRKKKWKGRENGEKGSVNKKGREMQGKTKQGEAGRKNRKIIKVKKAKI